MKKVASLFTFILLFHFSYSQSTSTTASGAWSSPGNWSNGVPTSGTYTTVNHAMVMNVNLDVGDTTTINAPTIDAPGGSSFNLNILSGGMLDVNANMKFEGTGTVTGNLIIRNYDTLFISHINFNDRSGLVIEPYGVLYVDGNLTNDNGTNGLLVDGQIVTTGNANANDGSVIFGSGGISTDGNITYNGSGTIFGSTSNCTGPCFLGATPPSNCLLAYYPFNGNAQDASSYGNHGVPHNGVAVTTDRYGNSNSAAIFDGIDDSIVSSNIVPIYGDSPRTAIHWFKLDEYPSDLGYGVCALSLGHHPATSTADPNRGQHWAESIGLPNDLRSNFVM